MTTTKFELAIKQCRHILKTVENVMIAKFELTFKRCRNNLKTVRNITVKNSKVLRPKKCSYTLRIDQSPSKSHEKCSVFIIFECSHDAISKMCRLEFRFRNLSAKNVLFSCEREAYPSHFSPFSNLPALCERRLS